MPGFHIFFLWVWFPLPTLGQLKFKFSYLLVLTNTLPVNVTGITLKCFKKHIILRVVLFQSRMLYTLLACSFVSHLNDTPTPDSFQEPGAVFSGLTHCVSETAPLPVSRTNREVVPGNRDYFIFSSSFAAFPSVWTHLLMGLFPWAKTRRP